MNISTSTEPTDGSVSIGTITALVSIFCTVLTGLGGALTGGYQLLCVPRFDEYRTEIQELRDVNTRMLTDLHYHPQDSSS